MSQQDPRKICPYYLPELDRERSEDLLRQCLASASSPLIAKRGAFVFRDSSQHGMFVFSHCWLENGLETIEHDLIDFEALGKWQSIVTQHGREANMDYTKLWQTLLTKTVRFFRATRNDKRSSESLQNNDGPSVDYDGSRRLIYCIDSQRSLPLNVIEKEGLAMALGSCATLSTVQVDWTTSIFCCRFFEEVEGLPNLMSLDITPEDSKTGWESDIARVIAAIKKRNRSDEMSNQYGELPMD
eukprot:TRINITY_DN7518_c0_g1_i1.p1 TRINITY_DN7518_c0_g1~~TRINITY_DN7518_c0_g1_i1.p1  ORF type:complete len:242 (+),score=14.90 TRINITY_DN7518_c0_g1_i1:54-779(+)